MSKKKTSNTKSPLDDKYLRRPGQSLDEKIGELQGQSLLWIVVSGVLIAGILMEWTIALVKIPLEPIFLISPTLVVLILVIYGYWKLREIKKEIRNNKLGRDGERFVAECLENLVRRTGCYVYHDIVLEKNKDKFNLDHIIVSTYGIFVVETKTRSRPQSPPANIEFDGNSVTLTGHPHDSSPIEQVRRNVKRLREIIPSNIIQRPFNIIGIVVYPGWFIDKEQIRNGKDTWVSNAKYLEFEITKNNPQFTADEVTILNDKIREIPGTTSQLIE